MNTSKKPEKPRDQYKKDDLEDPSFWKFFFLVAILVFTVCFYVNPLWGLISSNIGFFVFLTSMLLISFFSSATEAALGKLQNKNLREKLQQYFDKLEDYLVQELNTAHEKNQIIRDESTGESIRVNFFIRRRNKKKYTKAKERLDNATIDKASLLGRETKNLAGALAIFSVFLSTAIATMIPAFINADSGHSLYMPWLGYYFEQTEQCNNFFIKDDTLNSSIIQKVLCTQSINIGSVKLFVFIVSSFPIMLAGKVIPKYLGLTFPLLFTLGFFSYNNRISFLARKSGWFFGWMVGGALYLIQLFFHRRLDKS